MTRTRLSSKGQVVIPKGLRDALRWEAGTELDVEADQDVLTIRRVVRERRLSTLEEIRRVGGMLKYNRPSITHAEIERRLTGSFRKEWKK